MRLSQGEKLILLTLASFQDGGEKLDLAVARKAILSGNTWALDWEFPSVPTEDTDPEIAEETATILNMWAFVELSVERLDAAAQTKLKEATDPFDLQFGGFHRSHDPHYGVAVFLIHEMGRYEMFEGRELDSNSPSNMAQYRRMLPLYEARGRDARHLGKLLDADQIALFVRGDSRWDKP